MAKVIEEKQSHLHFAGKCIQVETSLENNISKHI